MTPEDHAAEAVAAPPRTQARRSHSRWPGLVWALPLAALMIVGYLGVHAWADRGVDVVVSFDAAADARPGDTLVAYRGITVGRLSKVALSHDGKRVQMTLRLDRSTEPLLRDGTLFWLVGAKPTLTDLSSLKAAVAGVSIGMAPGPGKPRRRFVGLEQAPQVLPGALGSAYSLTSERMGATRLGSNVYYHGMDVGVVTAVDLRARNAFTTAIFIKAPYDRFVRTGTLFYNVTAVRISLSGLGVNTQLAPGDAAIGGGVEFDTPPGAAATLHPAAGTAFSLYADRGHALAAPRGPQVSYRILFDGAVGQLEVGAPVTLRGFQVGSVTGRSLDVDARTGLLSSPVSVAIEPERLMTPKPALSDVDAGPATDAVIERLAKAGFRARLAQSPPFVGAYVIELVKASGAGSAGLHGARAEIGEAYPIIPSTAAGDISALTGKADAVLSELQALPIAEIGANVRSITRRLSTLLQSPKIDDSLGHLDHTLAQIDLTVAEARPKIGPLIDNLNRAADQVERLTTAANAMVSGDGASQDASLPAALKQTTEAARSLRALADYLSRHPEALIRGKGAKP